MSTDELYILLYCHFLTDHEKSPVLYCQVWIDSEHSPFWCMICRRFYIGQVFYLWLHRYACRRSFDFYRWTRRCYDFSSSLFCSLLKRVFRCFRLPLIPAGRVLDYYTLFFAAVRMRLLSRVHHLAVIPSQSARGWSRLLVLSSCWYCSFFLYLILRKRIQSKSAVSVETESRRNQHGLPGYDPCAERCGAKWLFVPSPVSPEFVSYRSMH